MKNSEIHNGLHRKEVRDFLSLSMFIAYNKKHEFKNPPIPTWTPETAIEHSILSSQNTIATHQNEIAYLKTIQAITSLVKQNGWKEFDVSDNTQKDLDGYMCFIGTDRECKELMESIKKQPE